MSVHVCLYCGRAPEPGLRPLGTTCGHCGKTLVLTEVLPTADVGDRPGNLYPQPHLES